MSDIVERLREQAELVPAVPRAPWKAMAEAADEITSLRAQVAALEVDAGRYRHMRNNSQFQSRNGPGLYWYLPRFGQGDKGEQLDAAVDAALAARKGAA